MQTTTSTLLRYAALALPMAFAGLPIYVHVPNFYAEQHGVGLALLGAALLLVRLFDCICDPVIGYYADRYAQYRRQAMVISIPVLAIGYFALFSPPDFAVPLLTVGWLVGCMLVIYLAFSVIMICYYAAGVHLGVTAYDNTRVSSYREGVTLFGVLLASLLPPLLTSYFAVGVAYQILAIIFAVLMIIAAYITLPLGIFTQAGKGSESVGIESFKTCFTDQRIRWVLIIFFLNTIPTAITGTLFLFFANDVLQATSAQSGGLLALYFCCAGASIPLWMRLSKKLGKVYTLAIGMVLAIGSFIFAYTLSAGEVTEFAIICAISGIAVGADLALLPSLFADELADKPHLSGVGFGLWNFLNKFNLAVAAGLALPLLQLSGYVPNVAGAVGGLSFAYASLPCIFKIGAIAGLLASPLRQAKRV